MKRALIIAATLLVPATASAELVYLSCEFSDARGAFPVNLTADEASGIVTTEIVKTGHNEQFRALFSKDKVIFQNRLVQYTLSRIDLSLTRVTPLLQQTDVTQCRLEQPPKRAF